MNTIAAKKEELKSIIENAAYEWLLTRQGKAFKKEIESFECDPYKNGSDRRFNECGDYESYIEIDSPKDFSDMDSDSIAEILCQASDGPYLVKKGNTIECVSFLGEPVTINFSDTKRCYAIHSQDLDLKVNYADLIGDDDSQKMNHALFLIESAMRKFGYFPNIVEVDYYGSPIKELSTNLGNLTQNELKKHGEQFDDNGEN